MIIDPQSMRSDNHRAFTVIGAVDKLVDEIPAGGEAVIEKAYDCFGDEVMTDTVRMYISKVCKRKNIQYATRVLPCGSIRYTRLA